MEGQNGGFFNVLFGRARDGFNAAMDHNRYGREQFALGRSVPAKCWPEDRPPPHMAGKTIQAHDAGP